MTAPVINKDGKLEFVDPVKATEGWKKGEYGIPNGQPLYLQTAEGETLRVEQDQIQQKMPEIKEGLRTGVFSFSGGEQAARKDTADEQGGEHFTNFVQGAALGAGNVLTAGGLGLASNLDPNSKIGRMGREFESRKEVDPGFSTAGEIVGQVAAAAPLAAGIGATQMGTIAGAAAEGAAFGLGEGVKDLQETDLRHPGQAAEILATSIGLNALLGGAAGTAIKGVGLATKGMAKTGAKASKGLRSLFEKKTGRELSEGVAEAVVDTLEKRAGTLSAAGKKARRNIFMGKKEAEVYSQKLRPDLDELVKSRKQVESLIFGKAKKSKYAPLITDDAMEASAEAATGLSHAVDDVVEDYAEVMATAGLPKSRVKRLNQIAEEYRGQVMKSEKNVDIFMAGDDFKRALDKEIRAVRKSSPGLADDLKQVRNGVKEHLEDVSLYGKGAEAQAAVNKKVSALISNDEKFKGMFLTKSGEKEGWDAIMTADPAKIQNFVNGLGSFKKELHEEVFTRQVQLMDDFLQDAGKLVEMEPGMAAKLTEANRKLAKVRSSYNKASDIISEYNQGQELLKGPTSPLASMGEAAAAAAGGVVGGLPGFAAAGAVARGARALSDPAKKMKILYTLDNLSESYGERVAKALQSFSKASKAVKGVKVPKPSSKGLRRAAIASYDKTVESVRSTMASPDKLIGATAELSEDTHGAAPNTTMMAQTTLQRAMNYLASNIPPSDHVQMGIGKEKKARVSDLEKAKFMDIYRVLDNPASILDDLAKGTLRRTSVMAVKEVYPDIYGLVVEKTLEELSDKDLPYAKRIQLGVLLDIPADVTMTPEFINAMQSTSAPPGAEQGRPPQGGNPASITQSASAKTAGDMTLQEYERR